MIVDKISEFKVKNPIILCFVLFIVNKIGFGKSFLERNGGK